MVAHVTTLCSNKFLVKWLYLIIYFPSKKRKTCKQVVTWPRLIWSMPQVINTIILDKLRGIWATDLESFFIEILIKNVVSKPAVIRPSGDYHCWFVWRSKDPLGRIPNHLFSFNLINEYLSRNTKWNPGTWPTEKHPFVSW